MKRRTWRRSTLQQRVVKMLENPRAPVLKALKEKAEKEAVRDAELEVRERAETDADGKREDRRREAATMTALDDAEAAAEREEDALSGPETKLPTTEDGKMVAGKLNPPEHIPM